MKSSLVAMKSRIEAEIETYFSRTDLDFSSTFIDKLTIPMERGFPLSWLRRQTESYRFYWSNAEAHIDIAGLGCAKVISSKHYATLSEALDQLVEDVKHPSQPRFFGGVQFPNKTGGTPFCFILPLFEMVTDHGDTTLNIYLSFSDKVSKRDVYQQLKEMIQSLSFTTPLEPVSLPNLVSKTHVPDRASWLASVQEVVDSLHQDGLEKVVLARQTTFLFSENPDPFSILQLLNDRGDKGVYFGFQQGDESVFLGVSPELLYKRKGRSIQTEAIAGTIKRGRNDDEDNQLVSRLMSRSKDLKEHQFVCDMLGGTLQGVATKIEASSKPTVLRLSHLHHLISEYSATLHSDVSDKELILAFHPTPAVAGTPTQDALTKIAAQESFGRGWYTGFVGTISADVAEFSVAIRSGLVCGQSVVAHTGAGIIDDSNPEEEWQELEHKLFQLERLFNT